MAIQNSGPLSISDIRDEFDSNNPASLSQYYRNGPLVPGNNTNVPTSGTISMSNFYGAVNEIVVEVSSPVNNLQLSNLFGSNWGTSVPKRVIIQSGVVIGGTSTPYALRINTGMSGTVVVDNSGFIQGSGGAANGGTGGNAIQAQQTAGVTVINRAPGRIYGGGGGGGKGGKGGNGGYGRSCSYQPNNCCTSTCGSGPRPGCFISQNGCAEGGQRFFCLECGPVRVGGTGGNGGPGGRGRGFNQTSQNGSNGQQGGNAINPAGDGGPGGKGGDGGGWGLSGGAGAKGTDGQAGNRNPARTLGVNGDPGGPAGFYITNRSSISFTNNGTVLGR